MCAYCNMGDFQFRYNPPWYVPPQTPFVPQPVYPMPPLGGWPVEQLREYLELMRQVKEMEEKLGCPSEPNKADYIKMFEERLAKLKGEFQSDATPD